MIFAILIVVLSCIANVCLIAALQKKVHKDTEIQLENQKLQDLNTSLNQQVSNKQQEISIKQNERNQLDFEISQLRERLNHSIDKDKEISDKAFQAYYQTLENSYKEIEEIYDLRKLELEDEFTEVKNDLVKLRDTRAAAHQALLKEQEIKENKDNYRLIPSEQDLADARRLEIVKRELNKPRILSMLVWQTYWQPLAKKQFPVILQSKTKTGIYKITNQTTDECYVGQAVDVYKRWCEHCKCGLGIDTPQGNKLYKAIQDYGLENFTFELLTECTQSELNEKEAFFIDLYEADTYGYNSMKGHK